jgi:hypothetical protein
MNRLWSDTDVDTEEEMLRLLREASVSKRFELTDTLTQSAVTLSRRALTLRRPDADNLEILLEWVGLHYGDDLETEVRDYLQSRRID